MTGAIGNLRVGIDILGTPAPPLMTPLGFVVLANLSIVTALNPPADANIAILAAEVAAVRFRDDGQDPSAAVGMPLPAGAPPWEYAGDLFAVRFIEQAPGAVLNVLFYQFSG